MLRGFGWERDIILWEEMPPTLFPGRAKGPEEELSSEPSSACDKAAGFRDYHERWCLRAGTAHLEIVGSGGIQGENSSILSILTSYEVLAAEWLASCRLSALRVALYGSILSTVFVN